MAIGNRVLFTQETRTGTNSADTELDWNDANVQIFNGTGHTNLQLPTADDKNSFGEVWVLNRMAQHEVKITVSSESGTVADNTLNDLSLALGPGDAAICRYVAHLRDEDEVAGREYGGWIVVRSG